MTARMLYIVARNMVSDPGRVTEWLQLEGPFEYPSWRMRMNQATPMTSSKAMQCLECFGGTRLVSVQDAASHAEGSPLDDSPSTLREFTRRS